MLFLRTFPLFPITLQVENDNFGDETRVPRTHIITEVVETGGMHLKGNYYNRDAPIFH